MGLGGGIFGTQGYVTYSPETIDDETRKVHSQAIREFVARDTNHPCVVLWSLANEPESDTEGADADTYAGLHALPPVPWSEEYQRDYLAMNHRVFDRFEAVVGEHVWNFADFATAASTARVGGNKKGAFTRDRQPKDVAWELRRRWRKER